MAAIDKLLAMNERVLMTANQSRVLPGGSLTTPNSIFLTTKRIIFENPRLLGLKRDLIDFMFVDLANVKIRKGIFSSQLELFPRWNSEKVELPAVGKKVAEELFSMIRKGMNGDLIEVPTQAPALPAPEPAPAPATVLLPEAPESRLERFAAMRDKGIVTEAEFQAVKTKLLEGI